MKAFSLFLIATLFLGLSITTYASLEKACKTLSKEEDGIDYNVCITSLQVVLASQTANNTELAIIATNLARANLTYNLKLAKKMWSNPKTGEKIKEVLGVCFELYGDAIANTKEAISAIKARDSSTFMTKLSAVVTNVGTCTDSWGNVGVSSPMRKKEKNARIISRIALGVAYMIQ